MVHFLCQPLPFLTPHPLAALPLSQAPTTSDSALGDPATEGTSGEDTAAPDPG